MDGVPFSRSTPVRIRLRDPAFPGIFDQIDRGPDPEREGNGDRPDNKVQGADDGRENPAGPPGVQRGLCQELPRERRKPVDDNVLQDDDEDGEDGERCTGNNGKRDRLDRVLRDKRPAGIPRDLPQAGGAAASHQGSGGEETTSSSAKMSSLSSRGSGFPGSRQRRTVSGPGPSSGLPGGTAGSRPRRG